MDEQASEQAQNNWHSVSKFRRELFKLCSSLVFMHFIEAFNKRRSEPAEASTPLPDLDDDLSITKYIQDRRVLGVC